MTKLIDTLADALEQRAARLDAQQDHYYVGQKANGSYYGVLGQDVKTRASAAHLRSPEFFEKNGMKAIKVMKRKAKA